MSELSVGTLSGLAANSYVIDVASGSQLTQPGMILQVVSSGVISTQTATTSNTFVDTACTVSITPTSNTSKIFITLSGQLSNDDIVNQISYARIHRGGIAGTAIGPSIVALSPSTADALFPTNITLLDSPETTSAVSYTVAIRSVTSGNNTRWNQAGSTEMIAMEVAA